MLSIPGEGWRCPDRRETMQAVSAFCILPLPFGASKWSPTGSTAYPLILRYREPYSSSSVFVAFFLVRREVV